MNKKSNFESKIREKLENHQVEFQDSYWNAYNEKYPLKWYQRLDFSWKNQAIFAYSALAFVLGFLLRDKWTASETSKVSRETNLVDTVVMMQTTIKKDTVYLIAPHSYSNTSPNPSQLHTGPDYYSIENKSVFHTKIKDTDATNLNVSQVGEPTQAFDINRSENQVTKTQFSIIELKPFAASISDSSSDVLIAKSPQSDAKEINPLDSTVVKTPKVSTVESNDQPKELDSLLEEDPKIAAINAKKSNWDWGLGLYSRVAMPNEFNEIKFLSGVWGGISTFAKRDRFNINLDFAYGSSFIEIEEIDKINSQVTEKFTGYSALTDLPEDIYISTQTFTPRISFGYELLSWKRFGAQITGGALGILPIQREFIYNINAQNQIRTTEFYPFAQPLTLIPEIGISVNYNPAFNWQVHFESLVYPNQFNTELSAPNNISPVTLQLGIRKIW